MSEHPWMPLYVGDYLQDTRRLSAAQHGAYLLLIMEYWQTGGVLPDDDEQLARITAMPAKEWKKSRPIIQAFFCDGWRHRRIDEELSKAGAKHARRVAAGSRGGNAKAAATSIATIGDERIESNAGSIALASSSQPQPQELAAQPSGSPGAKEKIDRLETELRDAAGLANDPSTGLFDLSPMITLLDKGWSLSRDILPKLRAAHAAGKYGRTWAYYIPGITEGKAKNGAIRTAPNTTPSANPTVWVHTDSPVWASVAERYRQENHAEPTPRGSRQGLSGLGIHVPAEWLQGVKA